MLANASVRCKCNPWTSLASLQQSTRFTCYATATTQPAEAPADAGGSRRYLTRRKAGTTTKELTVPLRAGKPSVAAVRQFEVLWLKYREELQLGKQAAASVLDEVAKGRLPCDADLLRNRARMLVQLDPLVPRLRLRQLLASTPRTLLAHDPQLLLARAARFAALLPSYDTTHVLMTVMPHLDRDPAITAANLLELDDVYGRVFSGARVPPSVFAHLLRASGATVLPPPPPPLAAAGAPPPPSAPSGTAGAPALADAPPSTGDPGYVSGRSVAGVASQGRPPRPDAAISAHEPGQGHASAAEPQTPENVKQRRPQQQQPPGQQAGGWAGQRLREPLVVQRRHVNPTELLRRLQDLVSLFGRETAYVAVQRHPALLDRDPRDLAARVAQLLAAVDPRVGGSPAVLATGSAAAAPARPLARLLEDAPEALDVELGEVRRRLQELSSALRWRADQVGQLALHAPEVLLRDTVTCRENVARLRLYSLRRPSTWGVELAACLKTPNSVATAAAATAATVSGGGKGRGRRGKIMSAANTPDGDGASASAAAAVTGGGYGYGQWVSVPRTDIAGELDAELLSLVAKILTVDAEVVDRFEYLILTGERSAASVRELLYEGRVKFVRQCPRYSRWWAEGVARQRGEGDGAFGLGSGLEERGAEGLKGLWQDGKNAGRDGRAADATRLEAAEQSVGYNWDEDYEDADRLLESDHVV